MSPRPSKGFPPIARPDARVLVLGSLPGQVSLARSQYYAQPQNAFWRIMGELVGAGPELAYEQRAARLRESGIALWDVCRSARRVGSLDAAIDFASVVPNDFATFFEMHPQIACVFTNGGTATRFYRRLVLPRLPDRWQALPLHPLPSTSPAYASMRLGQKLEQWREVGKWLVVSG